MRFEVSHRTTYAYRYPVVQSRHVLHLEPRATPAQTPLAHNLLINPAPTTKTALTDYFGNRVLLLRIDEEHRELVVHSRSAVEMSQSAQPDIHATSPWNDVAADIRAARGIDVDVMQFVSRSRHAPTGPSFSAFARRFFPQGRPLLEGVMALTQFIHQTFKFDPRATDVSTPVSQVLEMQRGVCQDFAHLSIAALRSLGIPCRYVSGYLLTRPPPGQIKLQGADASHAWISVWAPETGWVDFDPTNGVIPSQEHITVGWGRDYEDVSPIGGVLLGGGDQRMSVAVDVELAG
jgi:transglutaminase-like putative cysteine protease